MYACIDLPRIDERGTSTNVNVSTPCFCSAHQPPLFFEEEEEEEEEVVVVICDDLACIFGGDGAESSLPRLITSLRICHPDSSYFLIWAEIALCGRDALGHGLLRGQTQVTIRGLKQVRILELVVNTQIAVETFKHDL